MLLTASSLKMFRRCSQEYHYRYVEGVEPVETSLALRLGSLVHVGLESWWINYHVGEDEQNFAEAVVAMRAAAGDIDPYELVRAEELLFGYHVRWHADKFTVKGVEEEFATPLDGTDWMLAGKLDVRAVDSRGRNVVIEHKTSSVDISSGSHYWDKLRLDAQVSMYFRGAESLGHPIEAIVYDVLGKPKLKPYKETKNKKYTAKGLLYANQHDRDETTEEFRLRVRAELAENPDKYYQRGEVVRLESEVQHFLHELYCQANAIEQSSVYMNPDACERYGSMCAYFPMCTREADKLDQRLYKITPPHTELSDVIKTDHTR